MTALRDLCGLHSDYTSLRVGLPVSPASQRLCVRAASGANGGAASRAEVARGCGGPLIGSALRDDLLQPAPAVGGADRLARCRAGSSLLSRGRAHSTPHACPSRFHRPPLWAVHASRRQRHGRRRTADTLRLLILGDSFGEGVGVEGTVSIESASLRPSLIQLALIAFAHTRL